jgi:3-hydroxyisobutyrate dehydrogenase
MTGRELAPVVEQAGARLIDSPVFGTIPHVQQGKLYAMVGGTPEDLERARSVLQKLAGKIAHMGPNGSGYAMKLAVNLGLAAFIQATAESLALGTREGLKLEQMLDILGEAPTANGWFAGKKGALKGEPADVTLDLKTMRKDIMSAVATGALSGTGMPLSSGVLASLSAAVAQGWGDKDIGELVRFFREHMGQRFE